jgi:hypothetical protein
MNGMIDLELSTMGDLNREVRNLIPSLVNCLDDEKKKSSVTITITFQRMEDSETGLYTTYAVKPTYPKKARLVICRRDLVGNLHVEAGEVRQLNLPLEEKEAV